MVTLSWKYREGATEIADPQEHRIAPRQPNTMKYRSDIDGLRALAVIPVILFHAGLPGFDGGFVGVDIFFAISGYLIFGIISNELAQGNFSILRFYERRCRRILPELYLVIACTLPFMLVWAFPFELHEYLRSIQAAVTFRSNYFFAKNTEYFSPIADEKPLLHTWSLSVEEQFYLVFPIAVILLWKICKQHRTTIIIASAMLMFLATEAAVMFSDRNPAKLFFSTPYRAFELLFGAATFALREKMVTKSVAMLASLGLAILFLSFVFLREDYPFPSHFTLAPVIGTVLVLLYGAPTTWPCRLLSHPLISFMGKLSYGAYLWHLPLIAIVKTRSVEPPSILMTTIVALSSLPLAYISWRFVETPIKAGKYKAFRSRARVFFFAAFGAAALFGGTWIGTSFIIPDAKTQRESGVRCGFEQENCFRLQNTKVFLWGDSYADAFSISLGHALNARNEGLEISIMHGCPSLIDVQKNGNHISATDECVQHNIKTFEYIKRSKFSVVVLTSAYASYGVNHHSIEGQPPVTALDNPARPPEEVITFGLRKTVSRLREIGAEVVLVTPHPNILNFDVARKEIKYGLKSQIYGDYATAAYARSRLVDTLNEAGLPFSEVNGLDWFCEGESCPMFRDGAFVLFDGSHVSKTFAPVIADGIATKVEQALSRKTQRNDK